jgi:hypothetical protein
MENLTSEIGTFEYDNLIAGNAVPLLAAEVTLAKNQGVVEKGTVLGVVSATGLAVPVDDTNADGSENPHSILTDDVDTGDGSATDDFITTAYVSGLFNSAALIFGGDDVVADHELELRKLGIFLKENK